mmetsp:Transcript_45394/g.96539  ORF Transcript_45394/g.96539 Transcript_45394/m.96539 type:complete len:90 (+) Transcript_45394:555-824(+)
MPRKQCRHPDLLPPPYRPTTGGRAEARSRRRAVALAGCDRRNRAEGVRWARVAARSGRTHDRRARGGERGIEARARAREAKLVASVMSC